MKVSDLKIECDPLTTVTVWVKCFTVDDVDDLIAWLGLAKTVMVQWQQINQKEDQAEPLIERWKQEHP